MVKETDMKKVSEYDYIKEFCKDGDDDKIWWVETDRIGEFLFTFDKQTIFNLFEDYPHNLTSEQKEVFDKENPFWKNFFGE